MLLETKLYTSMLRPTLVERPHLLNKLNAGVANRLILVSALKW